MALNPSRYLLGSVLLLLFLAAVIPVPTVARSQATPAQPTLGYVPRGFSVVGELSPNTPVVGAIFIPLRNLPLLFYYAYATNEPGSPLYHHYLTQQQVSQLFYPEQEFEQVVSYLRAHNLTIYFTGSDSAIVFGGTAAQVEEALGVKIYLLSNGTAAFYEAFGQPSIPGAYVYVSNVTQLFLRRPPTLVTQADLEHLMVQMSQIAGRARQVLMPWQGYPLPELAGAYNATALYRLGINGSGVNVGIIDFYGNPTIKQDLWYFDQLFGLPNPPLFEVVPLGPYDPELGVYTGWNGEESLDVESVHSMAPGAGIIVYTPNGALPLAPVIAYIDQQDQVSIVSQSFSIPDAYVSLLGPSGFVANIYMADEYYLLGAAEGITFLASSGDGGGMGYSGNPLGSIGYPADSPFVTAVGGTTTYIDQLPNGTTLYRQTAWSAAGWIPFFYNFGGSTGGYSAVEPMPWYQWGIVPEPNLSGGFTFGRVGPDVAANANVYPGVYIVTTDNETGVSGGTSEASPLTAGLLALVEQYVNHTLGLINPTLYEMYSSPEFRSAFIPITFGYNIPWVAGPGYNLVTGLGAINAGLLAYYLKGPFAKYVNQSLASALSIEVNISQGGVSQGFGELLPGQPVSVSALIEYPNGTVVSSGSFYAEFVTVQGPALYVPLRYNSTTHLWTATFTMLSNMSGITFVYVTGSSGSYVGLGFAETFSGYYVTFMLPSLGLAEAAPMGFMIVGYETLLNGTPAMASTEVSLATYVYNMLGNYYVKVPYLTVTLSTSNGGFSTEISGPYDYDYGAAYMIAEPPAYGFTTFYNGVGLQDLIVSPGLIAMPASVSPGQPIYVVGQLVPPVNWQDITSYSLGVPLDMAIMYGSNLTAELVSPSGQVVATAQIHDVQNGVYFGWVTVPPNATPGLYKVYLVSNYSSFTLESIYSQPISIGGNEIGEVYVEPSPTVSVYVPTVADQNQQVTVAVSIEYPNGTPVKFGTFALNTSFGLYWLSFNGTAWVATLTTPITYSATDYTLTLLGVSSSALSVQMYPASLLVGKYVLYEDTTLTPGTFLPYEAVFVNDTIEYSGTISDSEFLGVNEVVGSNLTITGSDVLGQLVVNNSVATLAYSYASNVKLVNGTLILILSNVSGVSESGTSKVIYLVPQSTYMYYQSASRALYSLVSQVEANLSALRSQVENVTAQASYAAGELAKVSSEVASLESYLAGNVSALSARLAGLSQAIASNVSAVELELTGYEHSMSGYLVGNVSALNDEISAIRAQLASLNGSVSSISARVTSVNATLTGQLTGVRQSLSNYIAGNVSALEAQISQLKSTVASVNATALSAASKASSAGSTASTSTYVGVGSAVLAIVAIALAAVLRRH